MRSVHPALFCLDFTSENFLSRPELAKGRWSELFRMFGHMKPLDIFAFLLAMSERDTCMYMCLDYACRCMFDQFGDYDDSCGYIRVFQ